MGCMEKRWWDYVPLGPWIKESIKSFSDILFIRWKLYERKSIVLLLTRIVINSITCLTLRYIIFPHLEIHFPHWFEKNKYKLVECYVILWLFTIIAAFIFIEKAQCLFLFFLIWRLVDLFQSLFSINILSEDPSPYSITRMLILVLISVIEVSVIYALFYFVNGDFFISSNGQYLRAKGESLYMSVTTLTTIGSDFSPSNSLVGYSIIYSEIIFGVLFLIVVIQRIVSLFKN